MSRHKMGKEVREKSQRIANSKRNAEEQSREKRPMLSQQQGKIKATLANSNRK
jgi:hypothetical protein